MTRVICKGKGKRREGVERRFDDDDNKCHQRDRDEEKNVDNYWLDRDLDPALGQIAWRAMPGDAFILRAQKRAKENPGNLNFQEELTKAMEIEFPDAEKRSYASLMCLSAREIRRKHFTESMTSGNAVCKPHDLHGHGAMF